MAHPMARAFRADDIESVANGDELPELHMKPEEIAAVRMTYLQLLGNVKVDPITGEEENGLDRICKQAYKMDAGLTKLLFGTEATKKFEVDSRTGLRKKGNARDDMALLEAALKSTGAQAAAVPSRSGSVPPATSTSASVAQSQSGPRQPAPVPQKPAKRAASRGPAKRKEAAATGSAKRDETVVALQSMTKPASVSSSFASVASDTPTATNSPVSPPSPAGPAAKRPESRDRQLRSKSREKSQGQPPAQRSRSSLLRAFGPGIVSI